MRRTVFIALLLVCRTCLFAQGGMFSFYSVNEGLAENTVTGMYRDTFGYLWVGTGDGLSVFNGYEFKNFKSTYGDPSSLSNNRVRGILPVKHGKEVWVGTEDGFNIFSADAELLQSGLRIPGYEGKTHTPVFSDDTAVWIDVPERGIFRYSLRTKKFTEQFRFAQQQVFDLRALSTPGDFIYANDKPEVIWYSVYKNIKGRYPFPEEWSRGTVMFAISLNPTTALLSTQHGLWKLNLLTGKYSEADCHIPGSRNTDLMISAICPDRDGRIWLAVRGKGLFVCDSSLSYARPCNWQQNGASELRKVQEIQNMLCDPYNVIWIGTNADGLIRLVTPRLFFSEEYLSPLVTDTCNWFTRAVYADGKRRLWVGTFNEGLKIIDRERHSIRQLNVSGAWPGSVNAICPGPGNTLWLGVDSGLLMLDTVSWKMTRVQNDTVNDFPFISCLYRCKNGTLLASSYYYVYRVDESGPRPRLVAINKLPLTIRAIYERRNGDLVMACSGYGLQVYSADFRLKEERVFVRDYALPSSTIINGFAHDAEGNLWASSNIGLLQFDSQLHLKSLFTERNGLPATMSYGVMTLPDQTLLVTTGKGISIFDPAKKTFHNYSHADGMKSDECNARALFLSSENEVFIGGVNGFDYVQFPFREKNVLPSRVMFGQQMVFDEPFHLSDPGNFHLDFQQNTFSFQLWQTDFAFPERADFRYRLEGFDANEVEAGNRRYVRYSRIPPGDYTFYAEVLPSAGEARALFHVTIVPPYWQTTWFRLLMAGVILLVVVLSIYLFMNLRYRQRLRKLEMQRQLEQIRVRISADIHDDIGAGLTRIALAGDLAAMQLPEDDAQKKRVAGMAASARSLSQSLKEVVWSVKPEYDRYDLMARYFRDYCSEFFEHSSIRLSFSAGSDLPKITVSPEVRRNLFLVLKEALNNVAKHSGAQNVSVMLKLHDDQLSMVIRDDGKGCPLPDETTMNSSGLSNMKRRAGNIGFKLSISGNDEKESGTCISVSGQLK